METAESINPTEAAKKVTRTTPEDEQHVAKKRRTSNSQNELDDLIQREAALRETLQGKETQFKEAIALTKEVMTKVGESQDLYKGHEAIKATLTEEAEVRISELQGVMSIVTALRDNVRRMEAEEVSTAKQQAACDEELAAALEDAARHGCAMGAARVMEGPEGGSLWCRVLARALQLQGKAAEEAEATVKVCERKVESSWVALHEDKVTLDYGRLMVSELKIHRKHD